MNDRSVILDAWALLAFLQKEEPAATWVRTLIQRSQEDQEMATSQDCFDFSPNRTIAMKQFLTSLCPLLQ